MKDSDELLNLSYSEFVQKLSKPMNSKQMSLVHAALGVAGESGELVDAIKRYTIYGKELNEQNVIEELGDLLFYMQMLMNELNISMEDIVEKNKYKLSRRYYQGTYSNEQAIQRADKIKDTEGN